MSEFRKTKPILCILNDLELFFVCMYVQKHVNYDVVHHSYAIATKLGIHLDLVHL